MARLDRVTEAGEDQVGGARRTGTEHTDRVEPAVRCERADDSCAGGAVAADVAEVVLDDRRLAVLQDDRQRARQWADERMGGIDAAVDDAHVHVASRPSEGPVPRHDRAPGRVRLDRRGIARRQAPGRNRARAHVQASATSRAAVADRAASSARVESSSSGRVERLTWTSCAAATLAASASVAAVQASPRT